MIEPMPFEITRTPLATGIVVLTPIGTMTMGSQLQRFESTVEELVKNHQNRIVADMSNVTYLDSSAIGALVGCQGVVKNSGGQFRLAGLTDRVAKIFRISGVEGVLLIDANREAAVAKLAAA